MKMTRFINFQLNKEKGFSLVEVLVSLVIISTVAISLFVELSKSESVHRELLHKSFARELAINLFNELTILKSYREPNASFKKEFGGIPFTLSSEYQVLDEQYELLVIKVYKQEKTPIYVFNGLSKIE